MGTIKRLVDRLFIQQEHGNVFFSHVDGGLKAEEHYIAPDDSEVSNVFLLNADEKEALLAYLLEEKAAHPPIKEEQINELAAKVVEHDATNHQPWSAGFATGVRFATETLAISKEVINKADALREEKKQDV